MSDLKEAMPGIFDKRRIMRPTEVYKLVGLSDVTVWRLRRSGKFPKPIRLSGNRIGWSEEAILNWIASRPEV